MKRLGFLLTATILFSSCNHTPSSQEETVMGWVEPRLNQPFTEFPDLQSPLSQDGAVRFSLANHPDIQAAFAKVGIAEADLIEAGLISNPTISGLVRFQEGFHPPANIEYSLTQSLNDLLLLPCRKKVAESQLSIAELQAANFILDMAFQVQEAYIELQAVQLHRDFQKKILSVLEVKSLLAKGQLDSGNINPLDWKEKESLYLKAKANWMESEHELIEKLKNLQMLLGLKPSDAILTIDRDLPPLPCADPCFENLTEAALSQRFDLAILRLEEEKIKRELHLIPWWSYTKAALGASYEKDPEGVSVFGPAFSFMFPIFNYGQADRYRLFMKERQIRSQISSQEIAIEREVEAAYLQLVNARQTAALRQNLMLFEKQKTDASIKYYNSMALSLFRLLDQRVADYEAEMEYQKALKSYWLAKIKLDRAAGSTLSQEANENEPEQTIGEMQQEKPLSLTPPAHQEDKLLPYLPVVTPHVETLAWTMEDGFKTFHLVAEPVKQTFAPGLEIDCWGFNGSSPGPTIEAVEGDKIRIYVTNRLPEPTAVHWHGLILPNGMDGVTGLTQKPIPPNETFKYEFELRQSGTFMYHSHYDEMVQIGLGMMGLFIIHPKKPLEEEKADKDFAIMLMEWAIPIGGSRPDPLVMLDFNYFTFNGKVWPGMSPLVVKKGDKVRIRIANLSMDSHPIHLHGHEFTVVRHGAKRLKPSAQYDAVTINVPPGETRDIEFIADNLGDWPLHCHKTHHTMNGMAHDLPNLIGVDQEKASALIRHHFADYMPMGSSGMGEMFEHHQHSFDGPPNYLKMGTKGPFGIIELSGMFTILKVREADVKNPGWFEHPPSTVAEQVD